MQTKHWQVRLDSVADADGVAAVCDEFVGTWTEAELAGIPPKCRPPHPLEAADIGPYAIRLIAEIGVGNRTTTPLLYAMSTFFTKAALRIAEIKAVPPPPAASRQRGSSNVA